MHFIFKWLRRVGLGVGIFILILIPLVTLTPQGRTAFKTALFVPQILPAVPIKPQQWFISDPVREEVSYPSPYGQGVADVYRIADGKKRAAVLLFLGVNPAGRDDERVLNLSEALARAGFVVMIPWSPSMIEKRIDLREIDNLISAFRYLKAQDYVDPKRVGMGGFCVGASIAAVAASHPSISHQVAFLNFFGGYYDAHDLLKQISSRNSFYNGNIEPWQPDTLTNEVFINQLIDSLEDPIEREALSRRFIEKIFADGLSPQELSPEARTIFKLLSGVPIEDTNALIKQLPATLLEELDKISPSTSIGNLKARVMIMHDREDELVPSEESRRLADALSSRGNFYYTEFSFFQHVDATRSVGGLTYLKEGFKLYLHMYNIIRVAS